MGNVIETDGYQYSYDKNGNVTGVKTPEGREVFYTYDSDDRLIRTEEYVWEESIVLHQNSVSINAEQETLYPCNALVCQVELKTKDNTTGCTVEILYDAERLTLSGSDSDFYGISISDDKNGTISITYNRTIKRGENTLATLTFTSKDMVEGTAYVAVSPESTVSDTKGTYTLSECGGVLAELHLPDYNGDDITDLRDFAILAGVYGMSEGDEGWNAAYDITGNGKVTSSDLDYIKDMIFAGLLGADDVPEEQVSDHAFHPMYEIVREKKLRTTTYTYNAMGDISEITDCNGNKITYEYDSCGRTIAVIDQAGAKSTLEYDTMGNPTKVTLPDGVTEAYTYDSEGRVLTVTDALGGVVSYTYDAYGRVVSVTDAVGVRTELTYDIAGNVLKNLLTGEEYVYDVYGDVVSYTDAEGNTTTYTYDGQGNVTQVTDALGGITSYIYRKDGLLGKIEDASGAVTMYEYNARGLVESETDPLGAVTSYQYDKEDRVVRVTEPNGTVTEYEYNTDGNVTLVEATSIDGKTSVLRYLYAMDGSLTTSISDTDILTYQYDEKGQLTELHKNGVHSLGFGYDVNGNLLWLKESTDSALYNPDSVTAYTYDVLGRLTEVRKDGEQRYKTRTDERDDSTVVYETFTGGTLLAQYTYHADGTLDTMTDGAGTVIDYAYTLLKQVEQMQTVSVRGELLYSERNTYDGNGSLLERVTGGSAVTTGIAEYTYDALDRLLSEAVDSSTTTYTYDVMGNRLTKNADGVETAYTYDLCNKLLSEVTERTADEAGLTDEAVETGTDMLAALPATTYSYDAVGNLTEKVTPDGTVTYTYDAFNQLTNVTNPDGTWQTSTYDASGIRSMISENGITTEYVSFNGLVIGGYDKDRTQTEHYYYGTGLLATELLTRAEEPDGGEYSTNLYYYVKNSHGDVIGLTGNDGTLTETYTYDAFGTLTYIQSLNEESVLAQTDTTLSRFLHAGEQYDEVTGLYYLRARRYDTTVGRFTQEDTYLGDGRNLYVYVQNNPLKYVDPSGHDKKHERIGDGLFNLAAGTSMALAGTAAAIVATTLALTATVVGAPVLAVAGTVIMVATAAMGAGMAVMGVSDATQGAMEVYNAVTGNPNPAPNLIRDTVFGGNQEAYNQAEAMLSFGTTVGLIMISALPLVITTSTSGSISYYAHLNTSGSGSESGSNTVPDSLLQGDSNTRVYQGIIDGEPDYVGITYDVERRQSQHGDRFDYLREITTEPLTRRQARAIEQAMIKNHPEYSNIINSISTKRDWYNDAVTWGEVWLREHGLLE